jgi:shikimate kinase
MGTGKSAVGRALAQATKKPFIDLDELIEAQEKRKISDIFEKEGEPHFRALEKALLVKMSRNNEHIIACGGGIVMDKENIAVMKSTGTLICLTASVEAILQRTQRSAHRPLLKVDNPRERIESLLASRAPYYASAEVSIDTSKLTVPEVVRQISKVVHDKI